MTEKEKKKEFGIFYTSHILASFMGGVVGKLLSRTKKEPLNCVDPAVGDGSLLAALDENLKCYEKRFFCGLDIRKDAIDNAKSVFEDISQPSFSFMKKDGLFPLSGKTSREGWASFIKKHLKDGIHVFVSNPPWGTSLSSYGNAIYNFGAAKGQYDIYDLFLEVILDNLSDNGVYGIIVPDSIYNQEHVYIRKRLLKETTIHQIVRLGEGFFADAFISASIIVGIKSKVDVDNHKIYCSHLNHVDRKNVLDGKMPLEKAVKNSGHFIAQKKCIDANYMFLTDVYDADEDLITRIESNQKIEDFAENFRGVELSKKGVVCQCRYCKNWNPAPRGKNKSTKCKTCGKEIVLSDSRQDVIICEKDFLNAKKIIVGESIDRYALKKVLHIKTDFKGINYKNLSVYVSPKIVVRKTGVGITACIDREGCLTNQVVYGIRVLPEWQKKIPLEYLLAVLNSRITTYYMIKRFGCAEWKSHPYITQDMLNHVPVPYEKNQDFCRIVKKIVDAVKKIDVADSSMVANDAKVECLLLKLFKLNADDCSRIFESIENAQQLIPFKRLLNVKKDKVLSYGI